nr:phage-related protein tail component-like protein [uncultured Mediterranean phage uvMED]
MTDEPKIIRGAGAPKPPPPPYRAPDTLHSKQFVTIQDLISEGEIEGFASASKAGLTKGTTAYSNASLKDIFLDDLPILDSSADNTTPETSKFNFQNVQLKTEFGTSNQAAMTGIPNIGETRSIDTEGLGVDVVNADGTSSGATTGSKTKQIVARSPTSANADAVIVTLTWPALQVFETDGDIRGTTVEYRIQVQYNSGGYNDVVDTKVEGRSADAYQKDHRIDITGDFPVDIRVLRDTKDAATTETQNAFKFTSIQEVVDVAQTYPDSAYTALRVDSQQFNRVPTRKFRIRGIKVRIPGAGASSSGTPTVDIATGRIQYPTGYIFNGVMGAAVWTTCPSMVLLDLITNHRYGLGEHISPDQSTDAKIYENLDLFSFVAASKHANEEITDNFGRSGKEARFSCNVNIQSPKEAFEAINELAGVMRCMPIWSAGSINISQDKETQASYLFNLANVGQGGFSYQGSSLKQRHAIVSVSYFNMDTREVDFEVVGDSDSAEDVARRNKFGSAVKTVKAFACTSQGQAHRLGRAILFGEERESETVTFSTSIDAGIVVRPGSVIEINDPVRATARRGGRVISATTTTVTVDAVTDTTFPAINDAPTISVILSDGTVEVGEIGDITNAVITLKNTSDAVSKVNDQGEIVKQAAFSMVPAANSVYLLSSITLKTETFRVIQVEEQDDVNYVITALSYVNDKYDFIEDPDSTVAVRNISLFNQPVASPTNLTVTEKIITINSIARSKLIIDWQPIQGVTQYQVNYKFENNNYVSQTVFSSDFELLDTKKGTYTIQVFAYNANLKISPNPTEVTFIAKGKTALPSNVSGLTLESISSEQVRLRFTQSVDTDVLHGGRVYVRHTNETGSSATFQDAQDIIEAVSGNASEVTAPALPGTYLLKFQDDGGRFSLTPATVELSLVDIVDSVVIKTDREDTDSSPFGGTTTNTTVLNGALKLSDPSSVITGTYSQSGDDITCTINSHEVSVGDSFDFTFTSGSAFNGKFTVSSVTNANVFVVKGSDSKTTTGNVTVSRGLRGSYDFADILDIGSVFSLNLRRHFKTVGFFLGGDIQTATYTQSGTTVTVTQNSHGRAVGDSIVFDATSGAGVDGTYQIAGVSTNFFTFTSGTSQTVSSSNCTFQFVNTFEQLIPDDGPEFGGPADGGIDNYAQDGNFDGPQAQNNNAQVLVAATSANPGNGSTYQDSDFPSSIPFNVFANGSFKGRGFKFKLKLSTDIPSQNISVEQAGYVAEMIKRTETSIEKSPSTSGVMTSSASATTVQFVAPFFVGTSALSNADNFKPAVTISPQNMASGDYYVLSGITGSEFVVHFKDSSNASIIRNFTYSAVGFGKGG